MSMKISALIDLAKGNLDTNIVGLSEGDIVSATFGEIVLDRMQTEREVLFEDIKSDISRRLKNLSLDELYFNE